MSGDRHNASILGLKPGHDGAMASLIAGTLIHSFEAEKDSGERNGSLGLETLLEVVQFMESDPAVIAVGGWHRDVAGRMTPLYAGYHGLRPGTLTTRKVFGRALTFYSSSHERSHIFSAVAMAPYAAGQPMAILVWEGIIGALYHWDGSGKSIRRFPVLSEPGARYAALFCIADPRFSDARPWPDRTAAGKLMAVVGLADEKPASAESQSLVDSLLSAESMYPDFKIRHRASPLYNTGIPSEELARAAKYMSDRIFSIFAERAASIFPRGKLPLVISGGCGLNCDWNTGWRDSGIFSSVFVPPCANDSGSAIGTAVDAYVSLGGDCTIDWKIDSGAPFIHDLAPERRGWTRSAYRPESLADVIATGEVVAWVKGNCEIGPRALGHRSLIARATDIASRDTLNAIKKRAPYRPIAPACLAEDLGAMFDRDFEDPYMLYFRRVREPFVLPAVAHTDDSARVQSVSESTNAEFYRLLREVKKTTGVGVVCNTSLNRPGRGFINRMSDLLDLAEDRGVRHIVVDDDQYSRRPESPLSATTQR
ncbi:carbamoyltransferase C-terminal domain-containing protein [Streptomyces sp. PB17]|uniref:carbamoyltransferase C-terminal domain-containing protein n=1 Tax=Streptomyces sp. PB17 TaxID=3384158 RepID=UPI0038B5A02F